MVVRLMANLWEGAKLPTVERRKVAPMTTEQVEKIRDELPDSLKTLVTFAAGTGMRQGEVLGLTRDRLRLLNGVPITRQTFGHAWRPAAKAAG